MTTTKIIMSIEDLQEKLEEVIEERLIVHIEKDGEVVAVLLPIEDYEYMLAEIEEYREAIDKP